jgi:outer membrane protein
MTLDEELSTRFVEQKSQMNQMLLDTIINYVHRYNSNVGYDFILEYSKISGIFYANDSLDITESVLNGLNFEYRKWK